MEHARGYVQLIATGGTISVGPEGVLRASSMIKMARRLPTDVPVRGEDFTAVPSSQMTFDDMQRLAVRVKESLEHAGCLGVVITHGTDSMEESAVALEMLCKPSKPVVLTGAMVPSRDTGADGPANVADAIEYAASDAGRGAGTVVVMNGRVHAALEVQKLHTVNTDSFASGDAGPIGIVTPGSVELVREPNRLDVCADRLDAAVELVKLSAGGGSKLVDYAVDGGARGIVIEAFGVGNLPTGVFDSVKRAREKGVVVLITSRVSSGPLWLDDRTFEAGLTAAVARTGHLSGLAARIVLAAMLGAGLGEPEISDLLVREDD